MREAEGDDMADTTNDPERPRRVSEPLVLALIGLAIAALLFAGAAVPVLLSRDSGSDESAPTATSPPDSETTIVDGANDAPETAPTSSALPGSAPVDADSTATTVPPTTTTVPPTTTTTTGVVPAEPAVAESKATVRGGQLFLEGAVPDEAARDEIVALATEIFGPDNVFDEYVVDPRAGDASLGNVQVSDAVLFEEDSAVIAPAFEPLLNQGLALLQIRPAARFGFEGHTDSRGPDAYNLRLSQQRADAVVRWYTDRGVDASRLTATGRGETEPVASDDTAEGRQMNRRIVVTIENLLDDSA